MAHHPWLATMKKIAFLLHGHMRSFEFTHQSFNAVLNDLKTKYECDVFIHTWNELEPRTPTWHEGYLKVQSIDVDEDRILSIYDPVRCLVEKQDIKNPDRTIFHNQCEEGVLYAQYSRYKVNELKKQYEKLHDFRYDIVIVSRPDIIYYQNFLHEELQNHEFLWVSQVFLGGGSDILFASNSEKIDKVCEFYNHFHETPKSHNVESTLENYLRTVNLQKKTSRYCMPRDWKITRSWWGEDKNPSPGTSDHRIWDKNVGTREIDQNNQYAYFRI